MIIKRDDMERVILLIKLLIKLPIRMFYTEDHRERIFIVINCYDGKTSLTFNLIKTDPEQGNRRLFFKCLSTYYFD